MSPYEMQVEKHIAIKMRDGVRIALCVYRPDAPGQYPTLFAASPYQYEMDEVPAYPLFLCAKPGQSNGMSGRAMRMSMPMSAARAVPRANSS
jgi:hypothetical protein